MSTLTLLHLRLCDIYVSADLLSFEAPRGHGLAVDIGQEDGDRWRSYRRLDAAWFQWLAGKMAKLQRLVDQGQLDQAAATITTARFVDVQREAIARLGLAQVERLSTTPSDDRYEAPKVGKGSDRFALAIAFDASPRPLSTARQGRGLGPPGGHPTSSEAPDI